MKKILGIIAALALMLTVTGQAQAAGNTTTGAGSVNVTSVRQAKRATVLNLQGGLVVNANESITNSGGNRADLNTTGGTAKSGSAVSGVDNLNDTNRSGVAVDQTSGALTTDATNKTTGAGSVNVATVTETRNATVAQAQIGVVVNLSRSVANSGGNSASGNTVGGSATSGNASSTVINTNYVNNSSIVVNQ